MKYQLISKQLIDLRNEDLKLRDELIRTGQLGNGYNKEMAKVHNRNAELLDDIIEKIGYPTVEKVGSEGSEAAWLIIQHAIGKPIFMKRNLKLLERAVNENKANPKNLAYLSDRIAVLEGTPQLYGTQFDWDDNNKMSPQLLDDIIKVDQRRKVIGFNTLKEQTDIMRAQASKENELPPSDIEKRKREIEVWKKSVGWIA